MQYPRGISRFPVRHGTDTALGIKDKDEVEVESFGERLRYELNGYRKYKGGLCIHVFVFGRY